jgi:hypothetical protein
VPRDAYNLYDDYDDYDDVENGAPQSWLEDSFSYEPSSESDPPVPEEPPTRIGVALPPVVVIPAHPKPDGRSVEIELTARVSGDPVAIVFSNVERLIERMGRCQPWAMVPAAAVPSLLGSAAITIVLDPSEKICAREWTADRLRTLEEYQP